MNLLTLILRSLTYYWRSHVGTLLAAAVGTAVLTGALIVGDSVRYSLQAISKDRLGSTQFALVGGDHFFRDDLNVRISTNLSFSRNFTAAHSALTLPGIVVRDADEARAYQVQIVGVKADFASLGRGGPVELKSGETSINAALAEKLGAHVGDTVRIRLSKPGLVPLDAPLGSKADTSVLLRATVREILPDRGLGRFGLDANQAAPFNAFVPIADLQKKIKQAGRANLLLVGGARGSAAPIDAANALAETWTLDDAQIHERSDATLGFTELSSPRVFLDDRFADAQLAQGAKGITTYFVNAIRANGNATPYSMVTAAEAPLVDADLKDDEIELNAWAADDLKATPGDRIEIEYYVAGPMRQLEIRTTELTLKRIVPIEGLHADRNLMPEFPGIADVDTTHDWDSSIPIDMKKIRDKDEAYWKKYRGTPKAFITLNKGRSLWKNRFGTYTALRLPDPALSREKLQSASLGLAFTPVQALGASAAAEGSDFGGLFLGFSFFLIVGAMLLVALVFQFGVESRSTETGLLLSIGFARRKVSGLLLIEGTLLAALGSVLGVVGATLYAKAMLHALTTQWSSAVGTSALEYHSEPQSFAIGYVSGVTVAALAIFFAIRRQTARTARELLAFDTSTPIDTRARRPKKSKALLIAWFCAFTAIGLVAWAMLTGRRSSAEVFFSAGALLLIASLIFVRRMFVARAAGGDAISDKSPRWLALSRLGVRAASRRPGRSAATAALLACGAFLVVAVGANKQDATIHAQDRTSGTGGFEFYAESTIPIFEDLNTRKGRESIGVSDELMDGVTVYPFRVRAGDEASCLNLNRAHAPKILAVPKAFVQRGGFSFASMLDEKHLKASPDKQWEILNGNGGDYSDESAPIPAICDDQAVTYVLGKKLGETLAITDEHGRPRTLVFVGTLNSSILQGGVLIAEDAFLKLYPSQSGYTVFLIDTSGKRIAGLDKELAKALADEGFDPTPSAMRLARFNAVENTYLSTFAALGSLGMLLGSLGLGVVVLRNMLERRSELALLRAVGFSRGDIGWLVLSEHAWLLIAGLLAGGISALVAVAPALQSPGIPVPWSSISFTLLGVFTSGLVAAVLATAWMLRRPLLPALRSE